MSESSARAIGPCGSEGALSTSGSLPGGSESSPPPQIVINPARQKMLQKLALYEDGVLDSLQLLSSSSLPGTPGPTLLVPEAVADGAANPEGATGAPCSWTAGLQGPLGCVRCEGRTSPPPPLMTAGRPACPLREIVCCGQSPAPAPSPSPDNTHPPKLPGHVTPQMPREDALLRHRSPMPESARELGGGGGGGGGGGRGPRPPGGGGGAGGGPPPPPGPRPGPAAGRRGAFVFSPERARAWGGGGGGDKSHPHPHFTREGDAK